MAQANRYFIPAISSSSCTEKRTATHSYYPKSKGLLLVI